VAHLSVLNQISIYFNSRDCYIAEIMMTVINSINQALSEYKLVLANILRSRYVARTPPLEARSPGRRSNVENASVTCWSLISNARAPRVNYSNATGAPIANPPNSAQLGGSLYHAAELHPGPCRNVGVRPRTDRQTDRHTDAHDHNTFCVVYDSRKMWSSKRFRSVSCNTYKTYINV